MTQITIGLISNKNNLKRVTIDFVRKYGLRIMFYLFVLFIDNNAHNTIDI